MLLKKNNYVFIVNAYCGVSRDRTYTNMGYDCTMGLK